jgi:catechol 2,3-dioxygenase-like lactoylglutathione lyase family enzyme
MKLEVVVIPVSDVERAKRFYGDLGWRLDPDFVVGDAFRVVQFTPPRLATFTSSCRTSRRRAPSSSIAVWS